jgi:hypothetical protein
VTAAGTPPKGERFRTTAVNLDGDDSTRDGDRRATEWIARATKAIAREGPEVFEGLLVTVGAEMLIPDTRTTCRVHFVVKDGNGRPRIQALAERLAEHAIDYCIPRSRIREANDYFVATGSTARIARLFAEARELFSKVVLSGEGGELLLYLLLETVLGIPQVLCKMQLKTNTQMHVHGVDGVHATFTEGKNLAVYWGEAKLYQSLTAAIDECFESVSPFLLDAGGGVATRDLLLVRDHLDAGTREVTAALVEWFSPDAEQRANMEFRAACLVGFNLDNYPDPFDESGTEVRAEVAAAISSWHGRVGNRVTHHKVENFAIEVFCVPVPSVEEFRASLQSELGLK